MDQNLSCLAQAAGQVFDFKSNVFCSVFCQALEMNDRQLLADLQVQYFLGSLLSEVKISFCEKVFFLKE